MSSRSLSSVFPLLTSTSCNRNLFTTSQRICNKSISETIVYLIFMTTLEFKLSCNKLAHRWLRCYYTISKLPPGTCIFHGFITPLLQSSDVALQPCTSALTLNLLPPISLVPPAGMCCPPDLALPQFEQEGGMLISPRFMTQVSK